MIPLAAEDFLLQWIDTKFTSFGEDSTLLNWLKLLRRVYMPLSENSPIDRNDVGTNGDCSHLIDVDIFEASEPNTFDETIYTNYKCYQYLIKYIECAADKEKTLVEFPLLKKF